MTDIDDNAYDDIRQLLAEAKVETPIPTDVAARLDATLADLVSRETPLAAVIPLRRRLAPRLLVAAAAVVVVGGVGIGLGQVLGGGNDASSMTADSVLSRDADTSREKAELNAPEVTDGKSAGGVATPGTLADAYAAMDAPAFTSAGFATQASTLLDVRARKVAPEITPPSAPADVASPAPLGAQAADRTRGTGCTLSTTITPEDEVTRIKFDGKPAVLVVVSGVSDTQTVEAYDCLGVLLATTTVDHGN